MKTKHRADEERAKVRLGSGWDRAGVELTADRSQSGIKFGPRAKEDFHE